MLATIEKHIGGQTMRFSHKKAVYWQEGNALVLADLHFGKTGHFRSEGIPVPFGVSARDLKELDELLALTGADRIIVVGDMFHSRKNAELNHFLDWRKPKNDLRILLVMGNHDILEEKWYADAGIDCKKGAYREGPFTFRHDPLEALESEDGYYISGHLHPGIRLRLSARQVISLPCFYLAKGQLVLPAFSFFTGTVEMKPRPGAVALAVAEDKLFEFDMMRLGAAKPRKRIQQDGE